MILKIVLSAIMFISFPIFGMQLEALLFPLPIVLEEQKQVPTSISTDSFAGSDLDKAERLELEELDLNVTWEMKDGHLCATKLTPEEINVTILQNLQKEAKEEQKKEARAQKLACQKMITHLKQQNGKLVKHELVPRARHATRQRWSASKSKAQPHPNLGIQAFTSKYTFNKKNELSVRKCFFPTNQ